jgi:hypothetical protein
VPTPLFARLSDFQLADRTALKAMMDELMEQVEEQFDDVASQLATINAILNPDILDASEKAQLILLVQAIIDEKADINAKATGLGITTENTNYNNAYTALINYLNGLSPAWNDTSQSTVISRTDFDNAFEAFHSARQALFNKMDDVASAQSVVIDPFSDVIIYADSSGTIKTGELPRAVGLTASKGNSSVTTLGTWSRTATTGVTCTMGASTGILNITALSVAEVFIPISFTYSGVTRTGTVHVVRQDDPPTSSSGGSSGSSTGTTASTTTLANATSTSYDGIAESAILTVEAGAAGKVRCTAPIGFKRTPGTAAGLTGALGKWQWRAIAGSWADITTEVADTADAETIVNSGDPTRNTFGSLDVDMTKTGLTAGTQYEFKFLWRKVNVSGDVDDIYRAGGTLTADGTVS